MALFKEFDKLVANGRYGVSKERESIAKAFQSAVEAVHPSNCIRQHVSLKNNMLRINALGEELSLANYRLLVCGMGKSTAEMAIALEQAIPGVVLNGVVCLPQNAVNKPGMIKAIRGAHPVPDRKSFAGGKEMFGFVEQNAGEDSVTIALISGGGSSCAEIPRKGLTQKDLTEVNEIMLKTGIPIEEMNCIRSHISGLKGGQLALAAKGKVRGLIISDVPSDDLSVVASGPTAVNKTTFADAKEIMKKYGFDSSFPKNVVDFIERGVQGKEEETPKPSNPRFNGNIRKNSIENIVIANNRMARDAMAESLKGSYPCMRVVDLGVLTGDVNDIVSNIFNNITEIRKTMLPGEQVGLVWGGEGTLDVRGHGKGGRNLHQALLFAKIIRDSGVKGVTIGFMGTDGRDGKTDAAGAIIDDESLGRIKELGLSIEGFLNYCDSYRFLRRVDGTTIMVENAYTGTNVADVGCAIF